MRIRIFILFSGNNFYDWLCYWTAQENSIRQIVIT